MKIYGRIQALDDKQRILTLAAHERVYRIYLERGLFARHMMHLQVGHRVLLTLAPRKQRTPKWKVQHIHKIYGQNPRNRIVFSQKSIVSETKELLNSMRHMMFLDMEMSMHPYYLDKHFTQEIIQVGYVIVDHHNHLLKRVSTFIQPHKHPTLSKRTLKFLSLSQSDVDNGVTFKTFYDEFAHDIKTYQPAIIVWGKNDHIALKEALQIHDLKEVEGLRFVNLLQLHKNVFLYKDDLGLLKAYELYGHQLEHTQKHDALEDALMTYKIFQGMKDVLNKKRPNPHPRIQKS